MATGILQPTSRTPGAQEVDPATRGGREQRRSPQRRRAKSSEGERDGANEPETEAAPTTPPHRIDVLA